MRFRYLGTWKCISTSNHISLSNNFIEVIHFKVIQRRDYYPNQQENFNRKWEDYKQGFGKPNQEFWFGNDDLNWMTTSKEFILLVELKDFSGSYAFAFYNTFR